MKQVSQQQKDARIALGLDRPDLVLKNGRVVNVFSGRILTADVAVQDGRIIGVGQYEGCREIDLAGKFVAPGFIDAHLHLESTLVNPQALIRAAARQGTTTFIVDPHEAVNVSGTAGLEFYLEQTADVQANVFFMLPSCVPCLPFEDNGFAFTAEAMTPYVDHPRILGLGEVMDAPGVLNGDPGMMAKLQLFQDRLIDGHAGYLTDRELAVYRLAGIRTDHECTDFETARRELESGLQILIREGTAARNLEAIVSGILQTGMDTRFFSFCTDDKHIEDIDHEGHISFNIRRSIALGLDPVEAIRMATINTARCYRLHHLGAIAPGYQADLVVLSDLETVTIDQVLFRGELIRGGQGVRQRPVAPVLKNTVRIGVIPDHVLDIRPSAAPGDSRLEGGRPEDADFPVIELVGHQILTKRSDEPVPVDANGLFRPDEVYNKLAVFERHKATGKMGVGVLKGFGMKNGAIATTVAHDSHNLIVAGDNDADMRIAVDELIRLQGGFVIVRSGQVAGSLPLPVMGLISEDMPSDIHHTLRRLIKMAHQMGVDEAIDPFVTLSFISLPVIPEIRITTNGLFDVLKNDFIR